MTLMVRSVKRDQLCDIRELQTAHEVWEKFKGLYERNTLVNTTALRSKFITTKWTRGSALAHLTELQDMVAQLNIAGEDLKDKDVVGVMLASLPTSYGNVLTALDSTASPKDEDLSAS